MMLFVLQVMLVSLLLYLKLVLLAGIEPASEPYQDSAKNHSATEGLKIFCLNDIHWMQRTYKPYAIQTCFLKPPTLLFKQLSLVYLGVLTDSILVMHTISHSRKFENWLRKARIERPSSCLTDRCFNTRLCLDSRESHPLNYSAS